MEDKAGNAPPALTAINELLPEKQQNAVVRRVLARWKHAPGHLKKFFMLAVNSGPKIDGFREPLKAPHELVQKNVLQKMAYSPEFVGIVLQIWMSSHQELQGVVSKNLSDSELSINGLDYSESRFSGTWDIESWRQHSQQVVESHSQFTEDDIALMLCCVSGKMPSSEVGALDESADTPKEAFFPQWLEELQALPADSPQWQQATDFVASVTEIIQSKENERNYVERLKALLAEINKEFARELAFFQCDTDSWSVERLSRRQPAYQPTASDGIAELLRLTESLKSLLDDYKAVHDIAPNIQEELVLWPKRSELQRQILECLKPIYQLLSPTHADHDAEAKSGSGVTASFLDSAPPTGDQQSDPIQSKSTQQEAFHSSAEVQFEPPQSADITAAEKLALAPPLPDEDDETDGTQRSADASSAGEYGGPSTEHAIFSFGDYHSIETENNSLKQEIQTLQGELKTSQDVVRIWRVAYEKARKKLLRPDKSPSEIDFLPIEDVRTAVALAREKFAGELLFQPNSKSEIDDNPYQKPGKVWAALQWLATTYYRAKMGEDSVPDFGKSILKACGWSYTGKQSDITMKRYKPWYTTHLEGRTYWLKKHVGTGSNKDARYTIRIAFDWDQDRNVVLIGYIGQHQQTNAT